MRYRVGIAVRDDGADATVFDLVGCSTCALDRAVLAGVLPIAIAEHVSWLAGYGEVVEHGYPVEVEVTEEINPDESEAADGEFCFADDERPVTESEIETAIGHMGHASDDLRLAVEGLPDAVLDWRPPESAMARLDVWQPRAKTIREIAYELPAGERYYRLGLSSEAAPLESDDIVFDRGLQRRLTIERLRSLTEEERGHRFRVTRPWQDRPEHWTARKTIRRIISHERFHTREIQQRLAWLLLGVPDFLQTRVAAEGVARA